MQLALATRIRYAIIAWQFFTNHLGVAGLRPTFPPTKFQSFNEVSDPDLIKPRIKKLRSLMKAKKLDAWLAPHSDVHRSESLPKSERRLAHITGFTGSAGSAIIGIKNAALFVDGRYTMQAPLQTDTDIFDILEIPSEKPGNWAKNNLGPKFHIGFDPWLHTISEIRTFNLQLKNHGVLVATENLIEKIWNNRPPPPFENIELLGIERAGVAAEQKILAIKNQLENKNADALVLNMPESICWLLNIRGRDVPNTPVVLAFAIVHKDKKPELFINLKKLSPEQNQHLSATITLRNAEEFSGSLEKLATNKARIWVDPTTCPDAIYNLLSNKGTTIFEAPDPVVATKAIKNPIELAGMKQAHLLDGIALANFLCWFDQNASNGNLTEIEIASRLENFRAMEPSLVDISFDTISGSGPNGAIVHYRVNEQSNRVLNSGELMLVDSGGQYLSGTTDITRTLYTGSASAQQKQHFTLVLKGMIAISTLTFPKGTTGSQIDIMARHALWQVGLNYNHGTGHGVGAFLSVHEGPAGIAPRYNVPLEAGMIISNEPGYYLEGEYGIRIENLVHVINSADFEGFLAFETLTLAPIDTRLLDLSLLDAKEISWLNKYHAKVKKQISPHLEHGQKIWLQQATIAI
ncbi:MAG: aminopeptidase P family protein [Devosiaceae bacterium]|nr:aminopeptidase P family protein [Devosiaceae bacterium]